MCGLSGPIDTLEKKLIKKAPEGENFLEESSSEGEFDNVPEAEDEDDDNDYDVRFIHKVYAEDNEDY